MKRLFSNLKVLVVFCLFFALLCGCATKIKYPSQKRIVKSGAGTKAWKSKRPGSKIISGPVRYAKMTQHSSELAARRLAASSQDMRSWRKLGPQIRKSIEYIQRNPSGGFALKRKELRLTWGQLRRSLEDLERLLPRLDKNPELLGRYFVWYELQSGAEMTGYYTPVIDASLTKTGPYKYPVYRVPPDLRKARPGQTHPWSEQLRKAYRVENGKILPYHSRRAIDINKVLAGRGLEVAWLKDPVDLFYMHVQGGGVLRLPDGRYRTAVFSGTNGLSFSGLGSIMYRKGVLPKSQLSREKIKRYLLNNPGRMWELMAENKSYIFFKITRGQPLGAIGKPLMSKVSLATDPKLIPLGSIVSFRTDIYPEKGRPSRRVNGVGLAQDTGKAIRGARLDYYIGTGNQFKYAAHHLKTKVPVYLLVSRSALRR
ncbi:MltA domain-containing protein [Maridesulfovibrio hydrothermalis]|uniref:peptidoglycan lytic exotransglycosylase n=1 Tax=Maridesulfovibrio hydrothermalis AM13 = DSM 14728 TaxID=1121451 RepID=L0RCQ9_9BACT|nr:MltA domain-containing protein [Maridesulfovibrio hydrothermalis]CCO23997.1 MltA domain protein [Maridesulfovibrio hydrothermalis AM13 = DSM 14728]